MALESVDLASLLRRAKKTNTEEASAPVDASVAALANAVASGGEVAAPVEAHGATPAPSEPAFSMDEMRADLECDEELIQRILGVLYRRKRSNPSGGFVSILDMERILGIEREGAAFVMTYMKAHKVIEMDDKSRMAITVTGIGYLRTVLGVQSSPMGAGAATSDDE